MHFESLKRRAGAAADQVSIRVRSAADAAHETMSAAANHVLAPRREPPANQPYTGPVRSRGPVGVKSGSAIDLDIDIEADQPPAPPSLERSGSSLLSAVFSYDGGSETGGRATLFSVAIHPLHSGMAPCPTQRLLCQKNGSALRFLDKAVLLPAMCGPKSLSRKG